MQFNLEEFEKHFNNSPILVLEFIKLIQDTLDINLSEIWNVCSRRMLEFLKNEKWDKFISCLTYVNEIDDQLNVSSFITERTVTFLWKFHLAIISRNIGIDLTNKIRNYIHDEFKETINNSWFGLEAVCYKRHFLDPLFDNTNFNYDSNYDDFSTFKYLFFINVLNNFEILINDECFELSENRPLMLKSYLREIERQQFVLKFLNENPILLKNQSIKESYNFLHYSNILEVIPNLEFNEPQLNNLIALNHEYKLKILEKEHNSPSEIEVFSKMMVISNMIVVVKFDYNLKDLSNITDSKLKEIETQFRAIEYFEMFIDVIEMCLSIIFLRDKSQRTQKRFFCHEYTLEQILLLLKAIMTKKVHSQSYINAKDILKNRFNDVTSQINDFIWRFNILKCYTKTPTIKYLETIKAYKSYELLILYPVSGSESSSDDAKGTNKTHSNRRKPRKRNNAIHKTLTDSDQKDKIADDHHIFSSSNIISKLIGNVDSLIMSCLNRGDLLSARHVIKVRKF